MSDLTKELLRKIIHLTALPIVLGYVFIMIEFSQKTATIIFTGFLLLILEIEYIRINYQSKIGPEITGFFEKFILRKHEKDSLVGATFIVISTIISFSAFDYKVALTALSMMIFGDFAASLMGIRFGRRKIFKNKSYVGTLSGLIVNILVGLVILHDLPAVFIPMAITASFVETVTHKLDDNLTVPLFAGFVGEMMLLM